MNVPHQPTPTSLAGPVGRTDRIVSLDVLIVFAIWAAQLAWSPWWLARFRFGPFTYMRPQPMRREA